MLQIRKIVLRGKGVEDAVVTFAPGGNIVAGESDTGKSYLRHCLDYIFGADEMRKRIPESEPYANLFVEFENTAGAVLTLERHLSGGDMTSHECRVDDITAPGTKLAAKRANSKSGARDVTSVLFAFAGIGEAELRKNDRGETQRLTFRLFIPIFLIDEISVIDELSPVLGRGGFDITPRKRMLAYMLTGKDDQGIIAAEKSEIVRAKTAARLGVITDLLEPLERRIGQRVKSDETSIEKIEESIAALSGTLSETTGERAALHVEWQEATATLQRAESQLLAIDELLDRYRLLDGRYGSDLERLDFIAEGAHFFDGLQVVTCPLCDQPMTHEHAHAAQEAATTVYSSAKAEAAKILGHKKDLSAAILTLKELRGQRDREKADSSRSLTRIDQRIATVISPTLQDAAGRLEKLIARRVELESFRNDADQAGSLRAMKEEMERASSGKAAKSDWEQLPSSALRKLCAEIEAVLKEWSWQGEGRVEFDQKEYDIIVDGQARQSHGKGVRAVLHSAFTIGLLRYCHRNDRPHPGVVIIDSPLTSYKKGRANAAGDGPVSPGIEQAFWKSLTTLEAGLQVIIIENKEPPGDVADLTHYQWFAGDTAQPEERVGFIPPNRPQSSRPAS